MWLQAGRKRWPAGDEAICGARPAPGAKQAYRGPDGDILTLRDEPAPLGHHSLLQPVMRHGRSAGDPEPLAAIQRRCRADLAALAPKARALQKPRTGTGPDQRPAQEPPGPDRTRHHPAHRRGQYSRDHLTAASARSVVDVRDRDRPLDELLARYRLRGRWVAG